MTEVSQERTGWRDQRISRRHRQWGYDCPALDIDFLMLEYDNGKAVALAEYKHEDAPIVRTGHPSMRAITDLADRANLPAFVVRYSDDFSRWYVSPLNGPARQLCPQAQELTELEYVRLMYRCRGRDLPPDWGQLA